MIRIVKLFSIFLTTICIIGISYAGEISDKLVSKASTFAEEKLEFVFNDMINNVELDLSGFNEGKPEYGLKTIVPIHDQDGRVLFFQGSFSTQADIETINLGFGQRHLLESNTILIGANAFYDLDLENDHERWSLGADLLTSVGDIHANFYEAITDFKFDKNGNKEFTLDGFDLAIGFPLPYLPNSKLYAEAFSWNGINNSSDLEGETYSLKNDFPYGLTVELGKISYDKMNQDQEFISLSINFLELNKPHKPFKYEIASMISVEPFSMEFEDVSERRFEKVKRENKIKKQTNRTGIVRIVGY